MKINLIKGSRLFNSAQLDPMEMYKMMAFIEFNTPYPSWR